MASMRTLLSERRYIFLFAVAFSLLCLSLLLLLFTTNTSTSRIFSFYYPSSSNSKDLHNSQSFPPPRPSSRTPLHFRSQFSPPIPSKNPIIGTSPSTDDGSAEDARGGGQEEMRWKICGGEIGDDYIPCLDNWKAIKKLISRRHMEHRERHCPKPSSRCLVPLTAGYRIPLAWPRSRNMIWFDNVPHPKLVEYKKDQNWVRRSGDYLVFPGGGTQFKRGVKSYIQFIEKTLPTIDWGRHTRVILDVGCGVASFGGYLLDRGVITMSFAPKDEHEAQIQFALERGIPAILSVIGTQRLTFPDNVYDMIHCARCRVHWDADGGKPLLELNRILRPGGFFIWSATPVYRNDARDKNIWNGMIALTKSICWKTVVISKDGAGIGLVIYQKPTSNTCYKERTENKPPLCDPSDRPNLSWYTPLDSCLPQLPPDGSGQVQNWPKPWPERLTSRSLSPLVEPSRRYDVENIHDDTEHWGKLVSNIYLRELAINWSTIRNVMDMNAGFGGFAAALINQPVWVMNTVPVNELDTLSVIFNRGLIGIYHDWCEAFNTYPRTYDLLHSSYLFGNRTQRCDIIDVIVEMDRILRPNGWVLVQDNIVIMKKMHLILQSLHWDTRIHEQQFLVGKKGFWRPSN